MPRKPTAKATGVWEKEPGSGVWWIRYRAEGKLKRKQGRAQKRRHRPLPRLWRESSQSVNALRAKGTE
jgi:hypothetical protein